MKTYKVSICLEEKNTFYIKAENIKQAEKKALKQLKITAVGDYDSLLPLKCDYCQKKEAIKAIDYEDSNGLNTIPVCLNCYKKLSKRKIERKSK
jgi:hypothetical protein